MGSRWKRRIEWTLASLALGFLPTAYVVGWWWLRSEERAWAASFGSWEDFARAFPSHPANAAALRLDQLTRVLGFPMIGAAPQMADAPFKAAGAYLQEQAKSPSDQLPPPPAEVSERLAASQSILDEIEAHLLDGASIAWAQGIDGGVRPPIPSLWAHRHAHSVLLTRALKALAEGDLGQTGRSLEASWRLSESVCARPEPLSDLICAGIARWQNAVLRRWRQPTPGWEARLSRDFRTPRLRTLRFEAYAFSRPAEGFLTSVPDYIARKQGEGDDRGSGSRTAHLLSAPYVKFIAASYSRYVRRTAERLRGGNDCALDFDELSRQEIPDALPRWNAAGRIALPDLFGLWRQALESSLDGEQTRIIVSLRRRRKEGRPPGDLTSVPSAICPGIRWQVRAAPGGQLVVEPDRPPLADQKARQAWAYTLSP
jgi:hypothetical protein